MGTAPAMIATGSAKIEDFDLAVSGLEVECASMASFQPSGHLYDTNGVQPDILVTPTSESFIRGGNDPFLAKAFELLGKPQDEDVR